ncbi:MAG: hypothetical protein HUJ56_11985 [Erysipelotrichaceae bacterium]|nr:hypothetical protein [Erysipelotrichaceae bacterium]
MPLPFLFIGIAAASGALGAGGTIKAVVDNNKANSINTEANQGVDQARERLEVQRSLVSESLEKLGEIKLHILSSSVTNFVNTFEQIKNVDFSNSVGLEELNKLHVDQKDFEELKEMGNFAVQVAGGATAGLAGGALTAFGAYGAASAFATASTGTAISTLSGVAASNATLAFFGGGSLATGGLGMAGGAMVLGGLVAGPALLVMGLITSTKSQEKLDVALANKAQADEIIEALTTVSDQCSAIRRRTYMFYTLLAKLDSYLLPLVYQMKDVIAAEGTDYRTYSVDSKKVIMAAASSAASIKAVLDTPILTEDGELTPESESINEKIGKLLYTKN